MLWIGLFKHSTLGDWVLTLTKRSDWLANFCYFYGFVMFDSVLSETNVRVRLRLCVECGFIRRHPVHSFFTSKLSATYCRSAYAQQLAGAHFQYCTYAFLLVHFSCFQPTELLDTLV